MKLSEAMAKGNAELEPIKGYVLGFFDGNPCGCAIGSCLVGAGVPLKKEDTYEDRGWVAHQLRVSNVVGTGNYYSLLKHHFPQVMLMPPCPVCGNKHSVSNGISGPWDPPDHGAAIECLYERHDWPKEKIVAWVKEWEDSLEPKLSAAGDPIHAAGVKSEVKALMATVTQPDTAPVFNKVEEHHEEKLPDTPRRYA